MILKNKYSKIMQNIVVTSEMEERILNKLSNTPIEETSKSKKIRFHFTSKMTIAAYLLLLVISGTFFSNIKLLPTQPPISTVKPIEQFNNFDILNSTLKYDIKQPILLLTEDTNSEYYLIDESMVQILYIKDITITYRMAEGNLDISGDYNNYDEIKEIKNDTYNIILKGDEGKYSTIIFSDNKYSYSLSFERPLSEEKIIEIIKSLK